MFDSSSIVPSRMISSPSTLLILAEFRWAIEMKAPLRFETSFAYPFLVGTAELGLVPGVNVGGSVGRPRIFMKRPERFEILPISAPLAQMKPALTFDSSSSFIVAVDETAASIDEAFDTSTERRAETMPFTLVYSVVRLAFLIPIDPTTL